MVKNYERFITACGFLTIFVNIGMVTTGFGVHVPYMVEMPGMSHSLVSTVFLIRSITFLATMVIVSDYFRLLGCRVGLALACGTTAIGFVIMALSNGFFIYAVGIAILGMGNAFGGMVGLTVIIRRWYHKNIGTAIGASAVGSGVASLVVPLIVINIISAYSLQTAFLVEAAIAICASAAIFVMARNDPSDIGALPYGTKEADEQESDKPITKTAHDEQARFQISKGRMRTFLVAMMFVGAASACGVTYFSVLLTTGGYDALFAGAMVSVLGGSLAVGKFASGTILDALGVQKGTALLFVIYIVGSIFCVATVLNQQAVAVAAAVLFGFGMASGSTGMSVWAMNLSSSETLLKVARDLQLFFSAGSFLFNIPCGFIAEQTGSYMPFYALLAAGLVFASIVIVSTFSKRASQQD